MLFQAFHLFHFIQVCTAEMNNNQQYNERKLIAYIKIVNEIQYEVQLLSCLLYIFLNDSFSYCVIVVYLINIHNS